MFWGLALETGKRYAKTVETPFRISQAVLDTTTADDDIVRVMVDVDDCETLLCNLSLKHGILQCPLDLQFLDGEQIALYTYGGKGQVYLSGYLISDEGEESMFGDEEEVAEEEEAVSSDEEDVPELVAPNTSGKRKQDSIANPVPVKKSKVQQDVETVQPTKVTVCEMAQNGVAVADDDDDEEDDDYEVEDEGSDEEGEEEEDSDDDSDMEEAEEEEMSDEEMEDDSTKTPKAEAKTPKAEAKTPKAEAKTPKAEAKTPKAEAKTPKAEAKAEAKTPKAEAKAEAKTPKAEAKTPKAEAKAEAKTPKPEAKTPKAEIKTETEEKEEKSGSELDNSLSETKTPKKEKKKKKKEQLAMNGDAPQTPKQKTEEKQKQDDAPKTPKADKTPGKMDKTPKSQIKAETPAAASPIVSKAGGVLCEDLVVGTGQEAKNGRMVSVYYEGRLKSNNKMFDATLKGPPFKFRLGSGEVIKGWDVGVNGMKVGGKRRVVCPPHMAYGKRGAPPDIPKNATLTFTIELKGV